MISGGFDVTYVTYPNPAPGWVDGVYHERQPVVTKAAETASSVYTSRRFREKEETGWGVFDYHEGARFAFPASCGDFDITVKVRSHGDCTVSAYCDGMRVLSAVPLQDGVTAELSFTVRSCNDVSEIWFSPDTADGSDEAAATLEICSLSYTARTQREPGRKPTLFLASDSTTQTYDPYYYPQTGWGEVLYKYFFGSDLVREYRPEDSSYSQCRVYELPDIKIENRSIGGRSSRSFFLEGKLSELLARAARGDFIMIQFGHNDGTKARPNRYVSPGDYKEWVRRYIRAALARDITPILVTPVMRRNCDEGGRNGEFVPSFTEFAGKLYELAAEFDVPLLDLGSLSFEVCRTLGSERTKKLYLWAAPDEYEGAYANGVTDNTHLSRTGALIYAEKLASMLAASEDTRLNPLGALIDKRRCDLIKEALLGRYI